MEDCSQALSQELISQAQRIETKADLIRTLSSLAEAAKDLHQQVDDMGKILEANAIAEAKQRAVEISNSQFHCPYYLMKPTFDGVKAAYDRNPSRDFIEFHESLKRGDHLDTNLLPLHD